MWEELQVTHEAQVVWMNEQTISEGATVRERRESSKRRAVVGEDDQRGSVRPIHTAGAVQLYGQNQPVVGANQVITRARLLCQRDLLLRASFDQHVRHAS